PAPTIEAVHQLHADDPQLAVTDEVVETDDVRVVEGAEDRHLAREARQAGRVAGEERVEQLQRDRALRLEVERAIDRGGASASEQRLDAEAPGEPGPAGQARVAGHAARPSSARAWRAASSSVPRSCTAAASRSRSP